MPQNLFQVAQRLHGERVESLRAVESDDADSVGPQFGAQTIESLVLDHEPSPFVAEPFQAPAVDTGDRRLSAEFARDRAALFPERASRGRRWACSTAHPRRYSTAAGRWRPGWQPRHRWPSPPSLPDRCSHRLKRVGPRHHHTRQHVRPARVRRQQHRPPPAPRTTFSPSNDRTDFSTGDSKLRALYSAAKD